ncbi:TPA: SDR family oxidoreductase [Serratia marcescens]|uniref:SDR family oxidoreductase n=1 Tax=Serratia marcescens TaxID=615 RepID=UPI000CDE372C|nr:SDR family oxidoreductase [Serratia marcescens]POX26240.1 3-oxoacyl-ACP reductase [Serratia marcescens]HAT4498345.1 SDR family oxidoreductase [Serratia marcescens]HAT4510523.1 SDR family oxidoreductase [Serratia marcescens]HAT4536037.1 SDR family oxidoreductase [Serratia marcescens]HBV0723353.1 SDR family oxidoreductase [Serratia marcescens]
MDMKLADKHALVCASSSGLGYACAAALLKEGASVWINGRNAQRLGAARQRLQAEIGGQVQAVVADITTQEGRAALLAACPDADILVNNNAGPEPGNFFDFDEHAWLDALQGNLLAALMLIRALAPGMRARKFGRIINITSAMVSTPRAHMTLSAASRAGLTAACKGLSREFVADNVTINNLLPERFDTPRQQQMAHIAMEQRGITFQQARQSQIDSIPAGRMGLPQEFGAACVYLCSEMSGYMTGQNMHLDGGAYPALL